MKCSKCGTENDERYKFCGKCGTPISRETRVSQILDGCTGLIGQNCFVCGQGKLENGLSRLFSATTVLKCDFCSTEYHRENHRKFILRAVPASSSKWKFYKGQLLSLEELDRIAKGGLSDAHAEQIKPLSLSEKAYQIAAEKSEGWEVRLYAQVILDEIEKTKTRSERGQTTTVSNAVTLSQLDLWVSDMRSELLKIHNQLTVLFEPNRELNESGDALVMVARSRKIAAVYQAAVDWSETVRLVRVDSRFSDVPIVLASFATVMTEGIERFAREILRQVEDAFNALQVGEPPKKITATLEIKVPDQTAKHLAEAMERLKAATKPSLGAYIGQDTVKEKLRFEVELAKRQGAAVNHTLLCGPDGEGKTFLVECIANEMQVSVKRAEGDNIKRQGDIAAIVTNLRAGDIVLVKHIERLNPQCASALASAMTGILDMVIGKGSSARQIRLKMPRFTLVGTAPNQGAVREPLKSSFDVVLDAAPYDQKNLATIILEQARNDTPALDPSGAAEIARRANGSLRTARRLARQVRGYAVVNTHNVIDEEVVLKAFGLFGVRNETAEKDKTGIAFELKCMGLLRHRNFDVKSTKRAADGGVDLVAWSSDPIVGGKYVIQCKDWSNPVGAPVVRDLYGVVHSEDANRGILIAASSFTQEAVDFAAGKRLELIDGKELDYLLAQ